MNKKKIEILIIIFIGIILITSGIIITIPKTPKLDTSGYQLIKNRKVEVYSKVKVKDLIKSIDGKVVTNKKINTEKLGKKEIKFVYENKDGKERTGIVNLEVVDEEEPLIWLSNYYSVKVGSNLSLEDDILCADNYDNNPNCRVEGTYDLNTEGEYHLTYIATDSSNNEEKVDFTLNVEIIKCPKNPESKKLDHNFLTQKLYEKGIRSILIEAGGVLNAAFIKAGLCDRLYQFSAPKILGDKDAKNFVEGFNIADINDCVQLKIERVKIFEPDVLIESVFVKNL